MSQLKLCPFCNQKPMMQIDDNVCCCSSHDCEMSKAYYSIKQWNTRPEEDHLQQRVKTLREALENIKKHQDFIGGNAAQLSSTWRIAVAALDATEETP